jgi:glycosyltransferase involved in cell wall biosynthesis
VTAPSVCCLLLTADRQRFTDRAVACFLSQTYQNAWLLIFDTGEKPYELSHRERHKYLKVVSVYHPGSRGRAVGGLRNEAIDMASNADVIAHWDSDDWSAPTRLEEQVKHLLSHTHNQATGFHNLLFLDTREVHELSGSYKGWAIAPMCHAWEYDYGRYIGPSRNAKVLGTSLVYWRETWKACPFIEHRDTGEDTEWSKVVTTLAVQGVTPEPLLIAEVHGTNTSGVYNVFDQYQPAFQPEWRRAPEWDVYVRKKLYP